jgi:hypothetical protein
MPERPSDSFAEVGVPPRPRASELRACRGCCSKQRGSDDGTRDSSVESGDRPIFSSRAQLLASVDAAPDLPAGANEFAATEG